MKAPASMRVWFALMGALLWMGIYFTGFSMVSWLVYLPAAACTLAAVFGICPSQMAFLKLFGTKKVNLR